MRTEDIDRTQWTAVDYFESWAHAQPEAMYLVDHSLERAEARFTYGQFAQVVHQTAGALQQAGLGPGEVVAVQVPNGWEFVALTWAAWQLGAVVCPVMPIFRLHEVRQILEQTQARLWVAPRVFRRFDFTDMADTLRHEIPELQVWFRETGTGDAQDLARRIADSPAILPQPQTGVYDRVAEIVFTSGTTGRPKGVVHSHRTLMTGLRRQTDFLHLGHEDAVFMASPFAHQTGFLYGVLLPVMLGGRAVYQDVWEADTALQLMSEWQATFSMGATPFLADLTARYDPARNDLSALRLFISAGAPIPRILVEQAHDRLGVHILAGWGMSENSLVTLVRPEDSLEKTYTTDGRPVPDMQCRIVDAQGEELPAGEEGELQVRGPQNFLGYYRDPDTTRQILGPDGWLSTGDMAVLDEEGYLRITGRVRDMINRGGEKVPVAEVEELLYRHPAIREAALVAVPDARLMNRACACVVLREGQTLALSDLLEYLDRCDLTKQFWPERLEVMTALPKTPSGKIQKYRLREWMVQGAAPSQTR